VVTIRTIGSSSVSIGWRSSGLSKPRGLQDVSQLHPDAEYELNKNLVPGETVRVIIRGSDDLAMIGTDRRAFVFKKGWMSGAAFGQKFISWDYRNLAGVQLETGSMNGVLALQVIGSGAADLSYWGSGNRSPFTAPNALALNERSGHFEQAEAGVVVLRALIAAMQSPPPLEPSTPMADIPDQIRKLADLRDEGILTQNEFDRKKADLLRRL
jgi:putative oligomerization/nucleic acid binding protein